MSPTLDVPLIRVLCSLCAVCKLSKHNCSKETRLLGSVWVWLSVAKFMTALRPNEFAELTKFFRTTFSRFEVFARLKLSAFLKMIHQQRKRTPIFLCYMGRSSNCETYLK